MASIKYDGSKFYGFQRLNNEKTVQKELEKALTIINKKDTLIKGAGRTDRGVHAYNQIIHFKLQFSIPPQRLKNAINSIIDKSIYINYCREVDDNFHSRFDTKEKTYEYLINLGPYDPIKKDYLLNYNKNLNISKMKKASKYLIGSNSYQAFVSGFRNNYDSSIYHISIKKKKDLLSIKFIGKTFYNHMVRNLVGALLLVGENKINAKDIQEMLLKEKNIYHYSTVPACGLYLLNIRY
ncbi:MAG: tRNA pseudouridine(38-40) synthase TruA [Bacilli bacterium]|nr:tRNA pseudouridine(38-40) synthase TruA [Bacilli bacterium]